MAKVTGPLLSLDASGSVASTITFSRWKGINYVRQRVIPTYTNTTLQAKIRLLISDASIAWKSGATVGAVDIDAAYKLAYDEAASGLGMSGFNLFIKECVQLNGGSAYDESLAVPTEPGDVTP
jgi:hypothetical protein